MEGRVNNDDQTDMVEVEEEDVDSSSHVNKPYELGTEVILEIAAGAGGEGKCVAATELAVSRVGVCMERDGKAELDSMPVAVAGEGHGENQNRVSAGGGGEIIVSRSDDPPREVKVEGETECVEDDSGDAQVDSAPEDLLVEPQLEVEAEQELSPAVDEKLKMVGGDVGNAQICSELVMDAGKDDPAVKLRMKPEEELAVIDRKANNDVVTHEGDGEKSYNFQMDARDGELQAAMHMDAGRDAPVDSQLSIKPEEELVLIIDSKVEDKSYDFPMDMSNGKFQAATQKNAGRADLGNPHDAAKSEDELVMEIDDKVDSVVTDVGVPENSLDFSMDAREGELQEVTQVDVKRDDPWNPQLTMKPEEELAAVTDSKVDMVITAVDDEEKSFDFPMDGREGELKEVRQGMASLDYKWESGAGDAELVNEVRRVHVENNEEELVGGDEVSKEKFGALANDSDVWTAEIPVESAETKVDAMSAGYIPIPDATTSAEMATNVTACVVECAGNDVLCRNAEDNEIDPTECWASDIGMNAVKKSKLDKPVNVEENLPERLEEAAGREETSAEEIRKETDVGLQLDYKDVSLELLENSKLDKPENVEEILHEKLENGGNFAQKAVVEEVSSGEIKDKTEVDLELDSKDLSMELLENSKFDEPVSVEENLQACLDGVTVKKEASDEVVNKNTEVGVEFESKDLRMELLKNSDLDEPVNVQENLDDAAVEEEPSVQDIKKETEVGVELDSTRNVVMEEIKPTDAQVGADMGSGAAVDKTRDDYCSTEMEETPSDVDEPGLDNDDSSATPQNEEDVKMVAEETGTQDTIMETEIDILDSEKASDGKRKRAKVSKGPVSRAMAKTSRKKVEEDVCFICFDGGELVICDRRGCPKAYHPSCVNRDGQFFNCKGHWNCGWHLCSICEKNAQYMCYTCTFSLCKSCIKDASILCVRGAKGFCETCMRTVMLIENGQENKDSQVDFDDENSWEHLFKNYYIELKAKLSLSPVEIAVAKNPCKGTNMSGPIKQESSEARADSSCGGSCSDDPTENLVRTRPKRRKVGKQSKSLTKEDESISTSVETGDKAIILVDNSEWASKELLELVSHMKDGDTSVLSQFDVQSLLLEYIKMNKLRDPRRKSQIICDARLENLFGKPRVGHFEMLKLLESHFLIRDEHNDDAQGSVVDAEHNLVDTDPIADPLSSRETNDRKRKYRKKGTSRGPQSNLDDYAAIDMHNIGLIYLRRKLIEDLLEDTEAFHEKVVGTFVRIRISGSASKQDLYRLVQVVGTSKAPEPYKVGKKTTDVMVEILNLDKTEIVSIDTISNQEFSEEECKRLRQSIKCGLISRLTVGEILDKTMELQTARVHDWLESETLRLSHLRDRASDLGRRKELRECVEKLQRLKTPKERQRRLDEIPDIHADPKMDPSYESDDHESETEDNRQDAFFKSRSSSFSRRGRVPISPVTDNYVKDSGTGAGKVSSRTWEPSRDLSSNNFSISTGHEGEKVIENSSTLGRDRGRRDSKNLGNVNSVSISEPAEWSQRSVPQQEPSSSMVSVTSWASSSARSGENFVKINESEKIWHYQDPSGKVQGPFSMVQLRKWKNIGYFPADLRIWRTTESQASAILVADALAGKIPKESPPVSDTPLAMNMRHSSHPLIGHSGKASGALPQERHNADQMLGSLSKMPREKLLGNDIVNLPSPTPKQYNSGLTGVEVDNLTGTIHSPGVNGVPSSPTPVAPNIGIPSAPASILNSVFQAVAFSSIPNSHTGSVMDSAVPLHAQPTATREPPGVQMHSNPQAAVGPVQNMQNNSHGWAAGTQIAQPQGYGWNSPAVQNSSGSFPNLGTPSGHRPDVWRPTQSSQPNIHPPPATPDASWAMGATGNNASMGVRPDNPNMGWGSMPSNPNMGWGNPATGNPNMNWGPAMQVPPAGNTPGWVAPPGNARPNVQVMVPANPNPAWAPAQNWSSPPIQGQTPGPGWCMPGGNAVGTTPGNGCGLQSENAGGPPRPIQGLPQGSTNQGWVGPPGNQGVWNGEQNNHMRGQFSGQMGGQGEDPGFNGHRRPWNRQSSFGSGGSRRKRDIICPYNTNGQCIKGRHCNYLHT